MVDHKPADPLPENILSEAEVKAMAQRAVTRTFPKNTIVVTEGDPTDTLYIVVSGRVKIYASDEKGKEVVLNHAGPGEYFGELVLDGGPRSASVVTLEPTRFLIVPKEDFRDFVKKSPGFALHLVHKLIRRVRTLTNDVKSLALIWRMRSAIRSPSRRPFAASSRSLTLMQRCSVRCSMLDCHPQLPYFTGLEFVPCLMVLTPSRTSSRPRPTAGPCK